MNTVGIGTELRVLGRIELRHAGERITVPPGKQQAVLAVLAAAPEFTVSQQVMIDQVWPGNGPKTAEPALHTCVYRLRRLIPATPLISRAADDYGLDLASEAVDLHRFEQLITDGQALLESGDHRTARDILREALDLWHGEAFAGIDIPLVRERARALDEARLDAAEGWLTAELELGRNEEVSRQADALIEQHPLRERFWELFMIAAFRAGRQPAALEAYRRLYAKLREQLGIEPSPRLQEVQQGILAGNPDLQGTRQQRRPPSVPRQLPPATGDFVGRDAALLTLDRLVETLTRTGPQIALITGSAGVGKTALSLHWAHAVADEFPDGQLYADLHGFDESGWTRPVSELARSFLKALDVSDTDIPQHADDQVALFRTITAERRMLVVLDNARSDDQVRPLLPAGAGCCVLVTSRDQLAGLCAMDGGKPVPLEVLDDSESLELLANRIGTERVAADQASATKIIERCRGLPLALAIVAARVASQPQLSLAGAVEWLVDERRGLDALDAGGSLGNLRRVLSWSYDTLEPQTARLFRLLSVHPGPDISAAAAASLGGVDLPETMRHLDRLGAANLIREHVPGRYQLHDLLRSYAAELTSTIDGAEETRRAAYRVLDHYLQTAARGVAQDESSRTPIDLPEPSEGVVAEELERNALLRWGATEHAVLQAIVELGLEIGADRHVTAIVWSLRNYLATIRPPDPELIFQAAALTAAQRSGDVTAEIDALSDLASAHAYLGQHTQAFERGQRAAELATELGQPKQRGIAALAIGCIHETLGDADAVWRYTEEALHWFRKAGYEHGVSKMLNSLGWNLALRGDGAGAVAYAREAYEIYERLGGDNAGLADIVDTLGTGYAALDDFENSSAAFRRAIELYQRSGFVRAAGASLERLADLYDQRGDWAECLDALRDALAAYQDAGSERADAVRDRLIRSATRHTSAVS